MKKSLNKWIISLLLLALIACNTIIPENNSPIISSLTAETQQLSIGDSTVVCCIASDEDGDSLIYVWEATGGSFYGQGDSVVYIANSIEGQYQIKCIVSDGNRGEDDAIMSVLVSSKNQPPRIIGLSVSKDLVNQKDTVIITCNAYDQEGDSIFYTWQADAGGFIGSGREVMYIAPWQSGNYTITCSVWDYEVLPVSAITYIEVEYIIYRGTVTDVEGNTYRTVKIGNKWWMAENLKTRHYRDGTEIICLNDSSRGSYDSPAYAYYNNNDSLRSIYGCLYNYKAVKTGKLAPAGWHVPSYTDMWALLEFLGLQDWYRDYDGYYDYDGYDKLKAVTGWESGGGTDEFGFTALPGGKFGCFGDNPITTYFQYINQSAHFWAGGREMKIEKNKQTWLQLEMGTYAVGLSVRCVKDSVSN